MIIKFTGLVFLEEFIVIYLFTYVYIMLNKKMWKNLVWKL